MNVTKVIVLKIKNIITIWLKEGEYMMKWNALLAVMTVVLFLSSCANSNYDDGNYSATEESQDNSITYENIAAKANESEESYNDEKNQESKNNKDIELIDYSDAESIETALRKGENLEGETVQFVVEELKPDSSFGYNIWAGEHLNFVSSSNPDVEKGDTIIVKIATIESISGSWIIEYEKVDNVVIDEFATSYSTEGTFGLNGETSENTEMLGTVSRIDSNTLSSTDGVSAFDVDNSNLSEKPLELIDYGWFINPAYDDTTYVEFCGMVYNPNEDLIAEFPKVLVTVKNGDGSIVATEEQTGSIVMPKDTITLCGMFAMPISDLTEDAKITFDVDWGDLGSGTFLYSAAKTTDFTITNVSERNGNSENFITGEITNNYTQDIDQVNLSIVLRKDGKIVYMENTFLDNLKVGKTKAFEFQRYTDYPEHDTIEVSAMVW